MNGIPLMSDTMIHLQLHARECVAEVVLNSIPLKRMDSKQQKFFTTVAHSFLIQGRNKLELVVFPGPSPTRARQGAQPRQTAGASARARLVRFNVGDFADDESGETLLETKWIGGQPAELYPAVIEAAGEVESDFGDWSWQNSDFLALPRDGRPATEIIRVVHKAFREGQPQPILDLARVFLEEENRALPAYKEGELAEGLSKNISENAGRDNWVADLNETKFDLRLCADNHLIECVDADWQPLVRTTPQANGDEYPFPMFLGRRRGEWLILR